MNFDLARVPKKLAVGSRRCRCQTCGLYFNSTGGFDEHRVGRYDPHGDRRCLSDTELAERGFLVNSMGFVIQKTMTEAWKGWAT